MRDANTVHSAAKTTLRAQLEPLTLNPQNAAKLLGIGRDSFYKLIHAGKIKVIRVGANMRVPRKALDAYIDAALNEAN